MLQIYEESQSKKKGVIASWKDKMTSKKEAPQNLEPLLDLCKAKSWKGKNSQEVLTAFVEKAATAGNGKIAKNTPAMNKLIKLVNNSKTPDSVKMQFAQLTNLEIPNKVVDLKFKASDFDSLLKLQKLKPKNNIKDIVKADKAASMGEKVKKEANKPKKRSIV